MEITQAKLKMKRVILQGAECDEKIHACEVLKYDQEDDSIYLVLKEEGIDTISLDGIYECTLYKGKEARMCEGRVMERFCNQEGNILHFQVEKGFYKININCVDKKQP